MSLVIMVGVQAGVVVEHLLSANPRTLHTEVRRDVVYCDESGRITLLQ